MLSAPRFHEATSQLWLLQMLLHLNLIITEAGARSEGKKKLSLSLPRAEAKPKLLRWKHSFSSESKPREDVVLSPEHQSLVNRVPELEDVVADSQVVLETKGLQDHAIPHGEGQTQFVTWVS